MRMYDIETTGYKHITSLPAEDGADAMERFWARVERLRPDLVPILKQYTLLAMAELEGCWGEADFTGNE